MSVIIHIKNVENAPVSPVEFSYEDSNKNSLNSIEEIPDLEIGFKLYNMEDKAVPSKTERNYSSESQTKPESDENTKGAHIEDQTPSIQNSLEEKEKDIYPAKAALTESSLAKESPADEKVNAPTEETDTPMCRICFDSEESEDRGKLVQPCKCTGSVESVHQNCLKEWILSSKNFEKATKCEICSQTYSFSIDMTKNVSMEYFRKTGWKKLTFSIFLLFTFFLMTGIMAMLFNDIGNIDQKDMKSADKTNLKTIELIVACICIVILVALSVVIFFVTRKTFLKVSFNWEIYNRDVQPKEDLELPVKIKKLLKVHSAAYRKAQLV